VYTSPGSYTLSFSIDGGQTITKVVDVSMPAVPIIIGPTTICQGTILPSSYYGPPGFTYSWNASTGQTGTNQSFDVTWTNFPAQLSLTITDPLTGCSSDNSLTIQEYACPDSIEINIKVFLEGAIDDITSEMSTALYQRDLLPGMTFTNNQIGTPTLPGQPYNSQPWNYSGTEGNTYTNSNYANTVVDWILVSVRTGTDESDQIAIAAALLHKDGDVEIVGDIQLPNSPGPYRIVIQHRNHLPIMSQEVLVNSLGELNFDFTLQDSETPGTSFGQKYKNGTWMMYAGNSNQISGIPGKKQLDINGVDRATWETQNGHFQKYQISDMNLNGDCNGADKLIWSYNNGIFSQVLMTN